VAKKGCIVRIYAGGLFSSGRDLYVVSGQDGALIEVIVTPPSDGGPVTAAGYDFHDAVDLEVTKATYKRYLAHAKKNPGPIPNRGPLRRRTTTRDWIGKAITRPGKLGGAGFLSKSKAAQEKILRGCVAEYGYRSCLGSVMILERIPDIQNRWGARLAGLRHFLVRNFGGPGSFGPRKNPTLTEGRPGGFKASLSRLTSQLGKAQRDLRKAKDPGQRAWLEENVIPDLKASIGRVTDAMALPADATDPRLLEVSDLFMAGLNRKALAKLKSIPTRGLGTEDLRFHSSLSSTLKNPSDFTLVPEVSGCPLCAVKSNPAFTKAMANPLHDLSATPRARKAKTAPRKAKRGTSAVLRNAMRGT